MPRRGAIRWTLRGGFWLLSAILALLLLPAPLSGQTGRPRILFYNSSTPDDPWWRTSSDIMQAACRNLGMDLRIVYVARDRNLMVNDFRKVAAGTDRPDAVVFQNLRQNAIAMLTIAETYQLPVFIFNAGLTEEETAAYGGPRDHFKHWIGQILPDDEQAGYDLAMRLFREALLRHLTDAQGKVHFVAINGTSADSAAIERGKGLARAAAGEPRIVIHQVISANWDKAQGKTAFMVLAARYPMAKVVWSANDLMGLGVLDGIADLKKKAGKDFIVGSMDWMPDALALVEKGELLTTLDGHFMEAAWASVLLYDFLKGKDFAGESLSYKSKMTILASDDIENYLHYFRAANFDKIDFGQFSKVKHPGLLRYDFDFAPVFREVTAKGERY